MHPVDEIRTSMHNQCFTHGIHFGRCCAGGAAHAGHDGCANRGCGLEGKSEVRYIVSLHNSGLNCVSLQFGSFVSIYTSVVRLSL